MIKKSITNFSILGFMLLLIMLLVSAMGLYINHYGFSIQSLYEAYAGNEALFINPKSFSGILKSFSPHIFVMPLIFFILFHVAIATRSFKKEQIKYVAMIGFMSALGDIFITFTISWGIFFAYLKVVFMMSFELSLLFCIYSLSKKIYSH